MEHRFLHVGAGKDETKRKKMYLSLGALMYDSCIKLRGE
jgi:hypothetical protein